MPGKTQCEDCEHYDFDEVSETYSCNINLDEDEYERFVSKRVLNCPFYHAYDEYKTVRKQN